MEQLRDMPIDGMVSSMYMLREQFTTQDGSTELLGHSTSQRPADANNRRTDGHTDQSTPRKLGGHPDSCGGEIGRGFSYLLLGKERNESMLEEAHPTFINDAKRKDVIFKRFTMSSQRREIQEWIRQQPKEEMMSINFAMELIRVKDQADWECIQEKETDHRADLMQKQLMLDILIQELMKFRNYS
jgi:hypothetical protein